MKHKIFKIVYADGKYHYIVSYNSWSGLIPLVDSTNVESRDAIRIRSASIWELIKYMIKGV